MTTAIILSVGDELILGQTVDTNSAWLSHQLAAVGCNIIEHRTVSDDQSAIEAAMRDTALRCDFLICSGGIGPTEDDLSRQALGAVMIVPLELNEMWLQKLKDFWAKRNIPMPAMNSIQAMIPKGAQLIYNHHGTAAGIRAELSGHRAQSSGESNAERRIQNLCTVFVVPGVPREMKEMFKADVLPEIVKSCGGAVILSRTLHTFGLGESAVAEKLGALMKRDRNPSVGTTVSNGIVSLRVNARFSSQEHAQSELETTAQLCRNALGDLIFGQDEQSLQEVVATLLLSPKPQTVTTAESCTGGLLATMLTDVPGSSAYFKMGFITYSNAAKYERLGVSEQIIGTYGAVSEPVVEAMASNARRLAKSDYALAISGVAGPDGGTEAKPVGTVCIALASAEANATSRSALHTQHSVLQSRTFNFPGTREWVRDRAAKMALTMLRFHLLGKPLPF